MKMYKNNNNESLAFEPLPPSMQPPPHPIPQLDPLLSLLSTPPLCEFKMSHDNLFKKENCCSNLYIA